MDHLEDKIARQRTLRKLLSERQLGSQLAVVQEMRKRGHSVTQPSISRDFSELGVFKARGYYQLPPLETENTAVTSELVESFASAGPNLLVVKTAVGAANVVAAAIDEISVKGLVGTVAGDDTIIIACSSDAAQARIRKLVKEL